MSDVDIDREYGSASNELQLGDKVTKMTNTTTVSILIKIKSPGGFFKNFPEGKGRNRESGVGIRIPIKEYKNRAEISF